ncbi:hypothetical protein [Sanyastnella coralliicola]|uniref:hypothetical protein n=1 Tax=Sanyastnella coralliicola TaxID=3069118 RepID=UPI0027B90FD2|nr:hypothetical protein [Longitalea sp. SCSIO 12813]
MIEGARYVDLIAFLHSSEKRKVTIRPMFGWLRMVIGSLLIILAIAGNYSLDPEKQSLTTVIALVVLIGGFSFTWVRQVIDKSFGVEERAWWLGIIPGKTHRLNKSDFQAICLLKQRANHGYQSVRFQVSSATTNTVIDHYRITLLGDGHKTKEILQDIKENQEVAEELLKAWSVSFELPIEAYNPPRTSRKRR